MTDDVDPELTNHGAARRAEPEAENAILVPQHRGGRLPCAFDLRQVRRLAGLGLSVTDAAPLLGCSRRTLLNRLKDTPAIREAWDQGLAEAVARCATKLAERIAAGDLRAIRYFLSRKGGFVAPRPCDGGGECARRRQRGSC